MNPIDSMENTDLLQFFHRHKTDLACMEKPRIFLTQLRDHNLVPEDVYQKMSRMRSNLKIALYDLLDWLEKERPGLIHVFWKAVFKEVTMKHYPTLRRLHSSLMEETFRNKTKQEASDERTKKELSGNEPEEKTNTTPAKRKTRKVEESTSEEEKEKQRKPLRVEAPRKVEESTSEEEKEKQRKPLRVEAPVGRRRTRKVQKSTPLKKGEEGNIWMWAFYKVQLPVKCGEQEGLLDRNRMAKGEKCILHDKRWFTPPEFEKLGGKESSNKWKQSFQCVNTPLGKLIQEGHLTWAGSRERAGKARKSLFAASAVISDDEDQTGSEASDLDVQPSASRKRRPSWSTDEELDKQAEQEPQVLHNGSNTVFKVTCGAKFGDLHKERFASGTRGKCIRTETSWMTPVEFVEEALGQTDTAWRRDIQWEGKPISELIMARVLLIHSLLCDCVQCKPNAEEQEDQRNDDECWVCKREGQDRTVTSDDCPRSLGEDLLVQCDECPRSFHQKCHLPQIEDAVCKYKGQWLCTFCVFKVNQEYFRKNKRSREEAMSLKVSQHMLECQYLLLRLCACSDEHMVSPNSSSSAESESFPAACKEIRNRLSVIVDQLQALLYITVGDFVSNFQLVLASCTLHNQDAALIAVGDRLKKMLDEDFRSVFHIV